MARNNDHIMSSYQRRVERENRRGFTSTREATKYRKLGIYERPYEWEHKDYRRIREFGNHGEDGSIWGHSIKSFEKLSDANDFAYDLSRGEIDIAEHLKDDRHEKSPGRLARVRVILGDDGETWDIYIEAYVDYR